MRENKELFFENRIKRSFKEVDFVRNKESYPQS